MSAFIVSDKTINRILTMLPMVGELSREHLYCPKSRVHFLYDTDYDCSSLGRMMADMNIGAVAQRYDDEPEYRDGFKFELQPCSKMQLLKSLHCYLYQCSEGDVPERCLYKRLGKLRDSIDKQVLALYDVDNLSAIGEYDEADWD